MLRNCSVNVTNVYGSMLLALRGGVNFPEKTFRSPLNNHLHLLQVAYPPVHQRPAWTQPLTMVGDQMTADVTEGLPQLRSMLNAPTGTWNTCPQQPQPLPRPPSMRSRPQSAGSATRRVDRPVQLVPSGTFIPNRSRSI